MGVMTKIYEFIAIMVRYWDEKARCAITRFLAMPVCNVATGQTMFDALSKELFSRNIPWCLMRLAMHQILLQ